MRKYDFDEMVTKFGQMSEVSKSFLPTINTIISACFFEDKETDYSFDQLGSLYGAFLTHFCKDIIVHLKSKDKDFPVDAFISTLNLTIIEAMESINNKEVTECQKNK